MKISWIMCTKTKFNFLVYDIRVTIFSIISRRMWAIPQVRFINLAIYWSFSLDQACKLYMQITKKVEPKYTFVSFSNYSATELKDN